MKKTDGSSYEEIHLSHADEQIIEAAGNEASLKSISSVKTFEKRKDPKGISFFWSGKVYKVFQVKTVSIIILKV